MPGKSYKVEEIINILRKMEVLISQGQAVKVAILSLEISDLTYYRWKKEYGGISTDRA